MKMGYIFSIFLIEDELSGCIEFSNTRVEILQICNTLQCGIFIRVCASCMEVKIGK